MSTSTEHKHGYYATIRCAPSALKNATFLMPDRLKEMIKQLVFGSLLQMNIEAIEDRMLAGLLLSSVYDSLLSIEFGGRYLPITAEAVQIVTGLPRGEDKFSELEYESMTSARASFRKLCEENGMVKIFIDDRAKGISAYNKLNSKEVPRWVVERMINDHTKHGDDWILQCFFVLASNSLLFPTASLNIAGSDFAPVQVLETAQRYDWCQAICDDLKLKAEKFRSGRCKKVATPTIHGCALFIILYYLDNMQSGVALPGATPRWSVFTRNIIKRIVDLDKRSDRDEKNYGNLPLMDPEHTVYSTIRGTDINRTARDMPVRHCRKVAANRGKKPVSAAACDDSEESSTPIAMPVRR